MIQVTGFFSLLCAAVGNEHDSLLYNTDVWWLYQG